MNKLTRNFPKLALFATISLIVSACSEETPSPAGVSSTEKAVIELTDVVIPETGDYEAGVDAAFNEDYDTAFREFTIAAEAGLDVAQYNLAILYFFGRGVDRNLDEAFKWTEAAADQGHIAAMFNLGSLYYTGDGTVANWDRSVELYQQAGQAGHPEAAFVMATMYKDGDHVSTDPVQAHAWANLALSLDHSGAADMMESLESALSEQQLSEARRQFARWQIQ
jgi:TPR repeat protein